MSAINMNAEIYTQRYIIHMHSWSYHLISCSFVLPHEAIVYSQKSNKSYSVTMLSQIMSLPLFQIVQSLQIPLRGEAKLFSSCKVLQDLFLVTTSPVSLAASTTLVTSIFLVHVKPALTLGPFPLLSPGMPFSQIHLHGLFPSLLLGLCSNVNFSVRTFLMKGPH